MTHYIGGKTRKPTYRPPKPAPAEVSMICVNCKRTHRVTLFVGLNDLWTVCDYCGAASNILVRYDGVGNAEVIKGSIEVVE